MKRLVIDGDELVYKVGFASEDRLYTVTAIGPTTEYYSSPYKSDIDNWCAKLEIESTEDWNFQVKKTVEAAEDWIVTSNLNQALTKIMMDVPGAKPEIWLSSDHNFRNDVATLLPYKGHRDNTHKPQCYRGLKELLIDEWGANVTDGIEADDALGIAGYEDYIQAEGDPDKCEVVIVSQDKDLDMIPGWHLTNKRGLFFVNLWEANRWFFQQILMGDNADNIPGIKGLGKARSKNLLESCCYMFEDELVDFDTDEAARIIYEEYFWDYYWGGEDIEESMDQAEKHIAETSVLLWIMRDYR